MSKARNIADLLDANGDVKQASLDNVPPFENITDTGTEGTKVATGTSAQRGSTAGQIRFNTELGLAEYYDGSQFKSIDAPPTVSSISPTTALSANESITITGSNFGSGATVKFIGADGTEYPSPSVTVNSNTQITATTPSTALTVANEPYDVKVANISGLASTLAQALDAGSKPSWTTAGGNIGTVINGESASLSIAATDADGQSVSITSSDFSLTGLSLSSSGSITGTPSGGTYASGGQTVSFTGIASDGVNTAGRTFNIIRRWRDGTSSTTAAHSPYDIKQNIGSTPSTGVYWIKNGGINSGTPFQVLCDWSLNSTYGHIILCGKAMNDNSIVSFTEWGTAGTSNSGNPGVNNDFYSSPATYLNGWSGDTRNRFIVGMTRRNNSTSLSANGDPNWFELNVTPSTGKVMWDNAPGTGGYNSSNLVVASSSGTTGAFYWSTSHGDSIYQASKTTSDSVNSNLWMETRIGGNDGNHSGIVWGDGGGTYYGGNKPYATRWLFMGFSPDNA